MTLLHPERATLVAAALVAIAAIALVSWLVARRRATALLGSPRFATSFARDLVLLAALAAIGAALLGPQWGHRMLRVPGSGADVVLLLDVSRSMDAADVPPSRLARARDLASTVLERLEPEDRAALAVFADRGVVLSPLTGDANALGELVAAIDADLVEPRGSDLGAGVRAAIEAFDAASERPRVVVAIGDGEDADARDAGAAPARRANARVVAIALGTEAGATLADGGEPLRDARQQPVVARRDATRLEALANATGGAVLRADRWGDVDLDALLAAVRRDAASASGGTALRRVPALRTLPLALFALLLLALEAIGELRTRARAVSTWRRRAVAAALVLCVLPALGVATTGSDAIAWLEARLRERPGDARALIALGVARAEEGRLDEAAHALRAAAIGAAQSELAATAYYDLGVIELRRERFEAARDAFLDALALAPDDAESRFNLEWSVRALSAQPPEEPNRRDGESDEPDAERPDPDQPDPRAPPGIRPDAEAPPRDSTPDQPTPQADASRRFAPDLSPDRVEKWLDAIGDDPARGLRDAARETEGRSAGRAARMRW